MYRIYFSLPDCNNNKRKKKKYFEERKLRERDGEQDSD